MDIDTTVYTQRDHYHVAVDFIRQALDEGADLTDTRRDHLLRAADIHARFATAPGGTSID